MSKVRHRMEWLSNLAKVTKSQEHTDVEKLFDNLGDCQILVSCLRRSWLSSLSLCFATCCGVDPRSKYHFLVLSTSQSRAQREPCCACWMEELGLFVSNELPLERTEAACGGCAPAWSSWSRSCPQPCHLPAPWLQASDGPSHTWISPDGEY